MAEFDLVVRNGEVATGTGVARCDIGVKEGRIVALAERIAGGGRVVDAGGRLVLPGGVDSHCHIAQPEPAGFVHEESFVTASRSAFAGGTTTVVCFIPQFKAGGVWEQFTAYRAAASQARVSRPGSTRCSASASGV